MAPRKKKPTTVGTNGVFDDLNIIEEEVVEKAGYKLDLFRQVLPAIDRKDYGFFDRLSEKEQKGYTPFTLIRWMSTGGNENIHQNNLLNVNAFVNKDYFALAKHPGLQHQLLCMSSNGNTKHSWIAPMGGKRKKNLINDFFLEHNPQLRDDELSIIKNNTTLEEFTEYVKGFGTPDPELKKLVKAWKAENK